MAKEIITHEYEKGESCGNLGLPWRLLKRHYPELFKNVLVLQQPAAYRDGVVARWCMEDLVEVLKAEAGNRKCNIVQMHDMVGCQSTTEVKHYRLLLDILSSLVAADMTARLQLTDIAKAKKVHDICWIKLRDIKKWLKRKKD